MLSWSITFLIIGLVAGLLGVSGVAGAATQIAYVLFVVFLISRPCQFRYGQAASCIIRGWDEGKIHGLSDSGRIKSIA